MHWFDAFAHLDNMSSAMNSSTRAFQQCVSCFLNHFERMFSEALMRQFKRQAMELIFPKLPGIMLIMRFCEARTKYAST